MSPIGTTMAWTTHRVARLLARRPYAFALRVGLFALLAGLGGASLVVAEGARGLGPRLGAAAHLVVYLDDAVDEPRAAMLHARLARTPGIASVVPVSPAEAQARLAAEVERLRTRVAGKEPADDGGGLAQVEPAFLPRSLELRLDIGPDADRDPATGATELAARLRNLPEVLAVDVAAAGIDRQATWVGVLRRLALALPLFALAFALALGLAALAQRRRSRYADAEVASLIGATPLAARLPDVLLGALGALVGATIGLLAAPPLAQVALGLDRIFALRSLSAIEVAIGIAAAGVAGALSGALELPNPRRLSAALGGAVLLFGLAAPAGANEADPSVGRLDRRLSILQTQRDRAREIARRDTLAAYRLLRRSELEETSPRRDDVASRQAVRAALGVAARSQDEARSYAAEVEHLRGARALLAPVPEPPLAARAARLLSPLTGATVVAVPGLAADPATGVEQRQVGVHLLGRALDPVRAPSTGRVALIETSPTGGFVVALELAPGRSGGRARTGGNKGSAQVQEPSDGDPTIIVIISGLREVDVAPGDNVPRGHRLGALGRNLDGAPVLGIEAWRGGVAVDPIPLFGLRARPRRSRS